MKINEIKEFIDDYNNQNYYDTATDELIRLLDLYANDDYVHIHGWELSSDGDSARALGGLYWTWYYHNLYKTYHRSIEKHGLLCCTEQDVHQIISKIDYRTMFFCVLFYLGLRIHLADSKNFVYLEHWINMPVNVIYFDVL